MKTPLPNKINTDTAPKILTLYCAARINQLIDCIAELQAHVTNLKGGWTDVEIKAATLDLYSWPQIGDTIYRFNSRGMILECKWTASIKQLECRAFLGIFRTRDEAQIAKNMVTSDYF